MAGPRWPEAVDFYEGVPEVASLRAAVGVSGTDSRHVASWLGRAPRLSRLAVWRSATPDCVRWLGRAVTQRGAPQLRNVGVTLPAGWGAQCGKSGGGTARRDRACCRVPFTASCAECLALPLRRPAGATRQPRPLDAAQRSGDTRRRAPITATLRGSESKDAARANKGPCL